MYKIKNDEIAIKNNYKNHLNKTNSDQNDGNQI